MHVEVEDLDDVGMAQAGDVLGFALEAGDEVLVGGQELVHELDGDVAVEIGLVRLIHLSHAAPAEVFDDAISTDGLAGLARSVVHDGVL